MPGDWSQKYWALSKKVMRWISHTWSSSECNRTLKADFNSTDLTWCSPSSDVSVFSLLPQLPDDIFGLLFLIWFWFCPCLPLWYCYFCHIRTPMELSFFEKGFLGYPWYSWLCISQFHTLQYFTLVFHISLCAVDFKMFLFLYVNLLYLKFVLLFIAWFSCWVLNKMKWNEK